MRFARVKAVIIGSGAPIPKTVLFDPDRLVGGFWKDDGKSFIAFVDGSVNLELNRADALAMLAGITGGAPVAELDVIGTSQKPSGILT